MCICMYVYVCLYNYMYICMYVEEIRECAYIMMSTKPHVMNDQHHLTRPCLPRCVCVHV